MKVKKIAALAVGAAMVGATIGLASAQPTVPEIPKDFFVKDGQPNVKIVVGSQGAALDVSSAADIAVALGTMLYTTEDVKVKDASVVVKKDTAYDPDDIPVFDNTYTGEYRDGDNLQDQAYWWNGSFDANDKPEFTATFDDSAWEDGIFDQGWNVLVPSAIEWKNVANNTWQDPNGKWHSATDVMLHYNVTIGKVTLKQLNDDPTEYTDIDDFSDFTLIVDNVVANVTFTLNAYEKTLRDKVLGDTGITYTVSDRKPSDDYTLHDSNVISGVEEGDTIDLFGKTVKVLDIGSDYIEYGNDWGETYIDAGTSKTFGDYSIKVLDIDVNQEKALLEVSGPAGSEKITLNADDHPTETLFNGGIRVTLTDTFIGIG
jgi:S-layer protein (TIGR01564 family)